MFLQCALHDLLLFLENIPYILPPELESISSIAATPNNKMSWGQCIELTTFVDSDPIRLDNERVGVEGTPQRHSTAVSSVARVPAVHHTRSCRG
jgi:hypothetical protein